MQQAERTEKIFDDFESGCRRQILPPDESVREQCLKRWDMLCKPLGGLGFFEDLTAQIAAVSGSLRPEIRRSAVLIMGADNGVTAEGVSQCGLEVTAQVLRNMAEGRSTVSLLCKSLAGLKTDIRLIPVNVGVSTDLCHPGIRDMAVRRGSGDIMKGPAMTPEEAVAAVEAGIRLVREIKEEGCDLLIAGEMGIGNTTTSSAVLSALTGLDPAALTGQGAGLSDEGLKHKIEVIREALRVNGLAGSACGDPLRVLSLVGGLDIAALCGLYLGAAICRIPALIDGFITMVSACLAAKIAPQSRLYMIPTHKSTEPGCRYALAELGMDAPLQAQMHLGEAAGAVMFLPMLLQALSVYNELPCFEEGHIEAYRRFR